MVTTTIRLEAKLKKKLAVAASRVGISTHALMLEAIADKVSQIEFDEELDALADARWGAFVANGLSVSIDDAEKHVMAKAKGQPSRRPAARKHEKRRNGAR